LVFHPFYSANFEKWTEICDANSTIKLVHKIESISERSSNILRFSHPTLYDYVYKETMYVNQPNTKADIHSLYFSDVHSFTQYNYYLIGRSSFEQKKF